MTTYRSSLWCHWCPVDRLVVKVHLFKESQISKHLEICNKKRIAFLKHEHLNNHSNPYTPKQSQRASSIYWQIDSRNLHFKQNTQLTILEKSPPPPSPSKKYWDSKHLLTTLTPNPSLALPQALLASNWYLPVSSAVQSTKAMEKRFYCWFLHVLTRH